MIKMNEHYNEICLKCRNYEDCYIAKILKDSNEFNNIKISECEEFVEIISNVIQIYACKDCKNRKYTDSDDYCEIHKMSKDTWKKIYNINAIPNWCKLLKVKN